MTQTLNIAMTATLIGSIVAMLGALFAAHGLMPSTLTVLTMRRIFDLLRAIPEIVVALVLIFVLGGGPVPAMIAITLHTIGSLGKLFAEINDNADLRPIQGLSATGASWFQTMWFGLLPQTMPGYFSYILLRLEVNIRASAILGFVGAGGIGYEFKNAITWGQGISSESSSRIGPICLQGPHHSAQKSTTTGTSELRTSSSKLASVTATVAIWLLLNIN